MPFKVSRPLTVDLRDVLNITKHFDEGDKEIREDWVRDFKRGKTDLLFVYNMLLTGFDAERLKKLYLGRVIKAHNLLQALTRVNRPFNEFEYGYVIDFLIGSTSE